MSSHALLAPREKTVLSEEYAEFLIELRSLKLEEKERVSQACVRSQKNWLHSATHYIGVSKMYLSNCSNIFVQISNCTCQNCLRSGGTALVALRDAVGVGQLEDGQHGQAGFQALLQVPRADLVPQTFHPLLIGDILASMCFLFRTTVLAGNYHVVNAGLIFGDIGDDAGSSLLYQS